MHVEMFWIFRVSSAAAIENFRNMYVHDAMGALRVSGDGCTQTHAQRLLVPKIMDLTSVEDGILCSILLSEGI
jgi:hypothetical protein